MKRFVNILTGSVATSIIALVSLLSSCTMVEFKGDPINSFDDMEDFERSQNSDVRFEIEWPSTVSAEDMPEHVTVVMNRIQSTSARYVVNLDKNGNILGIVTPEDPETPEEPETEEPGTDDSGSDMPAENGDAEEFNDQVETPEIDTYNGTISIRNGFYSVAAIAVADVNEFSLPKITDFANSLETGMRDVNIVIPQLTREEKIENQYVDYNPVYPYIKSVSPFYYVRPSVKTHTEVWAENKEVKTVTLHPQLLTRKLTVKVPISIEEGVKIERLFGVLSGIPSEVQLMTGYVSDKNTSKMPIEFSTKDGVNYEGTINIFGLFPPTDTLKFAGPGILTLSIQASLEEDNVKYMHLFHSNINMKEVIEQEEIMILTEDRSAYRFSDTEKTDADGSYLEIRDYELSVDADATDPITRYMVKTGTGQGFNKWVPVTGTDDKESNPGLNPEV